MNESIHLHVSVERQRMSVWHADEWVKEYVISTAAKGVGFKEGSHCTPTGRFRIAKMIGGACPKGTIFLAREPVGQWDGREDGGDLILTRIMWLDGLDEENGNTMDRYIYIHGTNHESSLGEPSSHGCIRMANDDIIELFEMIGVDTAVVIEGSERTMKKLLFIDCDSTLSKIEGIDELAHARGADIYERVCGLTNQAMNGSIAIDQVFSKRMEMISPTLAMADAISMKYMEEVVEGVGEWIGKAVELGWTPVILSGGFAPLILPLAKKLGIEHVEAVPLYFDADGGYAGYGDDYPTTRNLGKNEIIREWKAREQANAVVMIGDGVSDLETKPDVDVFIGFGGVVARERVKAGCDVWVERFDDPALLQVIQSVGRS